MQAFKDKRGIRYPISRIDHIYPKHRHRKDDDWNPAKVYLKDGDEYGIEVNDDEYERLEKKMSRLLPANPGFRLLTFHPNDGDDAEVTECAIIGWREDEFGEFDPIIADESISTNSADTGILEPSGRVNVPYLAEYESREKWEEDMRRSSDLKKAKLASD